MRGGRGRPPRYAGSSLVHIHDDWICVVLYITDMEFELMNGREQRPCKMTRAKKCNGSNLSATSIDILCAAVIQHLISTTTSLTNKENPPPVVLARIPLGQGIARFGGPKLQQLLNRLVFVRGAKYGVQLLLGRFPEVALVALLAHKDIKGCQINA